MKKYIFVLILLLFSPSVAVSAFPDGWTKSVAIHFNPDTKILFLDYDRIILNTGTGIFDSDDTTNSADNGGGDIRFSTDDAGSIQESCEIVSFVTSSGAASSSAEIYVPGNGGGVVYMWWHNPGQTQPAVDVVYGRNSVWEGYAFVSHDGGATDSTGNNSGPTGYGSISGGSATGKFGSATEFNGSSQYFTWPDIDAVSFGNGSTDSPFTVQAWVDFDNATLFGVVSKYNIAGSNYEYYSIYNNGSGAGKIVSININPTASAYIGRVSTASISTGSWQKLESIYDGSRLNSGVSLWKNNTQIDATNVGSGTYTAMSNGNGTFNIGKIPTYFLDGTLDEIRVYNGEFTVEQRTAEYYNQISTWPTTQQIVGYVDLPTPPENFTDFRVCIGGLPSSITDNLKTDFADFRPTYGEYVPLHYDIPDTSNPNGEIWIKLPSYTTAGNGFNGTKTRIYFWGNNSNATAPAHDDLLWGRDGVYSATNLLLVSHCNDITTSTILDNISTPITLTKYAANNPQEATGVIGSCQTFNGNTSIITGSGNNNFLGTAGSITVVFKSSDSSDFDVLFSQEPSQAWASGAIGLRVFLSSGAVAVQTYKIATPAFNNAVITNATTFSDGEWHIATIQSNSLAYKIYIDGVEQSLSVAAGLNNGLWFTGVSNAGSVDTIGKGSNTTYLYPLTGYIDDCVILSSVTSANFEATQAANLLNITGYGTYGVGYESIPMSSAAILMMR